VDQAGITGFLVNTAKATQIEKNSEESEDEESEDTQKSEDTHVARRSKK